MRLAVYGGTSSLLAAGVIMTAMYQRSNFYSACVYLSKSSSCILILLNLGLFITIVVGKALQAIFFGDLRTIEVEHLYERSWYAVTETCLAMTMFRDDFDLRFILIFTILLFLKIFHWLCQDRVEYMEQSPSVSTTFHARMIGLMALLLIVDSSLAVFAVNTTMKQGPNMMIMFSFEYTILTGSILSILLRYAINVFDMVSEEPWDNKSVYVFYLDLVTEFFKLITYLVFFFFICYFYQLPLHIIRDVYVTSRSFFQKCRDLYRYRRATRNMNELYPNATADDLSGSSDSTCIICREEMRYVDANEAANANYTRQQEREYQISQPKKLPCGHIFHFQCLRSWLERQQSCPTCRRSVLSDNSQNTSSERREQPPVERNVNHADHNQPTPQQHHRPVYQSQLPREHEQQQPQQQQQQQQQQPQQQQHQHQQEQHQQHAHTNANNQDTGSDSRTSYPSAAAHANGPSSNLPRFNVLTPDTIAAGSSAFAIDGMIPLVPLSRPVQGNAEQPFPTSSSLPSSLTDDQIRTLSMETREAMVQRLHLLETVQNQIFHSMELLAQALSVIPSHQPPSTNEDELPTDLPDKTCTEHSSLEESNPLGTDPWEEGSSRSRKRNNSDQFQNETL